MYIDGTLAAKQFLDPGENVIKGFRDLNDWRKCVRAKAAWEALWRRRAGVQRAACRAAACLTCDMFCRADALRRCADASAGCGCGR